MKQVRFPAFRDRFIQLKGDQDDTAFAAKLGLTRQTVGFYKNGDRIPDALTLLDIADRCNVSVDWLLGRTNDSSLNPCAVDELGLTEQAVESLLAFKNVLPIIAEGRLTILNALLTDKEFYRTCDHLRGVRAGVANELSKVKGLTKTEIGAMDDAIYENMFELHDALYQLFPEKAGDYFLINHTESIRLSMDQARRSFDLASYNVTDYLRFLEICE